MNDPQAWKFNDKNISSLDAINFSDKDSPAFGSRLFLLKFYVLRKIDEVALGCAADSSAKDCLL